MPVLNEAVLRTICRQRTLLVIVFSGLWVLLLLTVVSAIVVDPDSATYVIVVLNLVGLIPLLGIFGYLVYRCRQLEL